MDLIWLGYLGGLMSAVGWALEGTIAGKGLDLVEADIGITVRYIGESIFWFVFMIPLMVILGFLKPEVFSYFLTYPQAIIWFMMSGFCISLYYVCWYKSFPLIGVGRGLSLAMPYVVVAFVFGVVFFGMTPTWNSIVGAAISLFGVFFMYSERQESIEILRNTN